MNRGLFRITCVLALTLAAAGAAFAQTTPTTTTVTTTATETVQNADGTWTVVQYPVNKEVVVNLTPTSLIPTGAAGTARIMRSGNLTTITMDANGLTNVAGLNVYAVDPTGTVTLLGPLNVANGAVTQSFTTPLDRFMLVASPDKNATAFEALTNVAFRSAVPQGFAVVPHSHSRPADGAAVGERVAATSTAGASAAYSVPMLGVSGMKRGEDTEVKVNFAGAMTGARANVRLLPRKDGPTQVTARFHELKEAPAGKVFVLWAVSPDNKYVKLGQIVNTGGRNEAEIKSETALTDFGLLVTMEDAHDIPAGPVVGTVVLR
ncbi:MAG TPA: hypothetical protein VER08_01595 [Pyrinomonadaceae bacterium]|nr:hypothetical protein [Pyrinomonadaceae bacterium]